MQILNGVILLIIGLLACFYGWRFYRIVLALFGFVIGYYVASGVLLGQAEAIQIGGAIIVGLLGALLFWTFYRFAQVLFGAMLGLVAAALIGSAFNLEGVILAILAIVLAIVGGLIGNAVADVIIRLGTAFSGAGQAIGGIAALAAALSIPLPLADPTHGGATTETTAGIITLVAVIVLGIAGYLFQTSQQAASQ